MRGRPGPGGAKARWAVAPAPGAPAVVFPGSGRFLLGLVLGLLLAHLLEDLGHVLDRVEDGAGHINRPLVLQRKDDRIARPRVDLDDLRPELVLHGEEYASEESLLAGVVDHDALEAGAQAEQDAADQ